MQKNPTVNRYFDLIAIATVLLIFLTGCKEQPERKKSLPAKAGLATSLEIFPSKNYAHLPRLYASQNALHASWVESKDSLSVLKYAVLKNGKWSTPETISSGTDWFVNWADFPNLAVNKGVVLATFLQKSAQGTYDYDIKYSIRDSSNGQWSLPKKLHSDTVAAEHGFVSLMAHKDGFFASWLDGRHTKSDNDHTQGHQQHSGAMSLRAAQIASNGLVSNRVLLDKRVCDCCNTATVETSEGVAVIYRDRSDSDKETRDIYSTVYVDGSWSYPAPVHRDRWMINGCPVNGPAIASKNGLTAAAWFTAAQQDPSIWVAFSQDGGLHFNTPVRMDAGNAVGRVGVAMKDQHTALVSWVAPQDQHTVLQLGMLTSDGIKSPPITISKTTAERQSGFPQIAQVQDKTYVVWTEVAQDSASIKMMRLKL